LGRSLPRRYHRTDDAAVDPDGSDESPIHWANESPAPALSPGVNQS
jgi:hypothetical protein